MTMLHIIYLQEKIALQTYFMAKNELYNFLPNPKPAGFFSHPTSLEGYDAVTRELLTRRADVSHHGHGGVSCLATAPFLKLSGKNLVFWVKKGSSTEVVKFPIWGDQTSSKCMVILRDFPSNSALFGSLCFV